MFILDAKDDARERSWCMMPKPESYLWMLNSMTMLSFGRIPCIITSCKQNGENFWRIWSNFQLGIHRWEHRWHEQNKGARATHFTLSDINQRRSSVCRASKTSRTFWDILPSRVKRLWYTQEIKNEYEVWVRWLKFKSGNEKTWKSISSMKEDIPGTLENYLHTACKRNLKQKVPDL